MKNDFLNLKHLKIKCLFDDLCGNDCSEHFQKTIGKGHVARLSNNSQNPHQISITVANSNFVKIYGSTVGLAQKAKQQYIFYPHIIFFT